MAELLCYGIIGDALDGLDAQTFTTAIRACTGPLSVRINSPGGYAMEGLAIIQALRDYPAPVTIYIDGLAASMASAIAMVGSECIMAESALMMVHKPWDSSIGNADDLRRDAAKLDRIEAQLIGIYAKRTGLPEGELAAMLAAETWMTPAEALAAGFITSITEPLKLVAMADVSACGFRHPPAQLKEPTVTDTAQAVAAERTRISTIMALCGKHHLPSAFQAALIERDVPLDQARSQILDTLAAQSDATQIGHTLGTHNGTTLDNPANRSKAMADAVSAKLMGTAATGAAAEYRAMPLVEMARMCLAQNGVKDVYRLPNDRVASLALQPNPYRATAMAANLGGLHTTSDFPDIMQTGVNSTLAARYQLQQSPLKRLTQERDVPDFKDQTVVSIAGFNSLDRVAETGEFKNRTLATGTERYKIDTFGNIIGFSRQMLVNDSLGALADIVADLARAAANLEADILAATINSNILMRSDGKSWFHADHLNLATTGGAPTIATLDAGGQAMRRQRDLSGTLIDAQPKFLLVPVTLQTAAETLVTATITPGTTTDPNPFSGKLEVIADPRLASATAWYLFADPAFAPAFVSAYLNGQRTPFTDSQDGFRVDGIEWKVRHDFGAGVVDSKMAWKNGGG